MVEFEEVAEDNDLMTGSGNRNQADPYYGLGGGDGIDNRENDDIGTGEGDALSKGGFLFAEADFEYSL